MELGLNCRWSASRTLLLKKQKKKRKKKRKCYLDQGFLKRGALKTSALDADAVAQALPSCLSQVGGGGEVRGR